MTRSRLTLRHKKQLKIEEQVVKRPRGRPPKIAKASRNKQQFVKKAKNSKKSSGETMLSDLMSRDHAIRSTDS